jgi:paraquat-inducible protein A
MNVSEQLGTHLGYTIFTGVRDLFQNGLWPLGALIFCTSIAARLVGCAVWRGSSAHLLSRTKISRLVAELGRWSDLFAIVFFVPLIDFGGLASSSAGWGATPSWRCQF